MKTETFNNVLTEAVQDFTEHGYDEPTRLANWLMRLRDAALRELIPLQQAEAIMAKSLGTTFQRAISQASVKRSHPEVSRFTVANLKPQLRTELSKRIFASSDLIRLNRDQSIEKTLQRFSGWATSVPDGGSKVVDKQDVKDNVKKALKQLSYEERRVAIDQGHKLAASVNAVIAESNGAIAAEWHSHWKRPGYNYREDHKERDKKFYAIRGSWAIRDGLVRKGEGYTDEMTQPGEEVYCSCYYTYLYNLRDCPPEMLTEKGRKLLEKTRVAG